MPLYFVTMVASLTLLKVQEKDTDGHMAKAELDPMLMNRHWYTCVGPQFPQPTPEEVAVGIKSANDVCCTREMTFQELCCMDFTNLHAYLTPTSAPPYNGGMCATLNTDAAQIQPGQPGAMVDDVAAFPNAPVAVICTGQAASAEIASEQGGAVVMGNQMCTTEEFAVADITGTAGAVVLDKRIEFLVKQGLPGSAIPVCHAQVPMCPAASGKCLAEGAATGCAPNSASDATLQGIGKGRTLAQVERSEDEMAAVPANEVSAGVARRQRSYMKTLGMLAKMSEADVREQLGQDMRFSMVVGQKKILRLHVEHVTAGDHFVLAGETTSGPARIEVANDKAELITGADREALDLDDLVLSSVGRQNAEAGRRGGGMVASPAIMISAGGNTAGNDF